MAASRCAVGGKKKPRGSREREGDALQGPNGRFVACVLGDAESVKGPHDLPCHLFRVSPSAVLRAVGSPFSRGLPSQVVAFLRQQGAGELGTTPEMRTSQLRRGKWVICICIGQILQRLGRPRGSSLGRGAPALVFEEGGRGEGGVRRAAGYNWHGQRWFVRRVDRYSRASGDDPDQALGPRSSLHLEQVRTEETARSLCVEGRRTLLLKLLFLPSPSLSVNLTISSPPPLSPPPLLPPSPSPTPSVTAVAPRISEPPTRPRDSGAHLEHPLPFSINSGPRCHNTFAQPRPTTPSPFSQYVRLPSPPRPEWQLVAEIVTFPTAARTLPLTPCALPFQARSIQPRPLLDTSASAGRTTRERRDGRKCVGGGDVPRTDGGVELHFR